MKKLLLILALVPSLARAEQIAQGQYFGLNNNTTPPVIDATESQDQLNVDISVPGNSFKKRSGYGVYKNITAVTGAVVRGGHHFFDTTGNDVQVWGSSVSLYGIVAGATPIQLVSSATVRSTWDCADTQGSAYCVDSSRDAFIKTGGSTMQWFASPLGTMVESTPDRLVVAGVSGTPNSIYHSQANAFTTFTVGPQTTDAFTEVIAAPGSKITHLRWACGKLLWWKDQSFGSEDFEDQYSLSIKTISDTIGTFDNTSAIDPGGNVWFRAQDGHTYRYDCSFLTKETTPITPLVQVAGLKTSNSWTQDSQSDFEAGLSVPAIHISTGLISGSVTVSSFSVTQFINTTVIASTDIPNNSFEAATGSPPPGWSEASASFSVIASGTQAFQHCGVINAKEGSNLLYSGDSFANNTAAEIVDSASGAIISSTTVTTSVQTCPWTLATITGSPALNRSVIIRLRYPYGAFGFTINSSTFTANGNDVQFYYMSDTSSSGSLFYVTFDLFTNAPVLYRSSSTTTSSVYDTTFTSSVAQIQANWSASISTNAYTLLTSTAAVGGFAAATTSTGTNVWVNRYVQFSSTYSYPLTGVVTTTTTIVSRSTGTYYSAVHNSPNLATWDTVTANTQDGGGSQAFFVRASTNSFSILSSTPAWSATTIGGLPTASTGTYIQFRDDFSLTAATATPTLNSLTLNWFEGTSSDQAYMEYFDNAIWQTVAYGSGQSTNNYVFKCDLLRYASDPGKSCWTPYNFGAGGFLVQSNKLYFGDTAAGNVFNYGTSNNDNGTAINAYRKSKEFSGTDPFMQFQISQIDTFAKKDQGSTLTATYTTDGLTSTSYSISLSTGATVAQSRKILPSGKLGYTFNIKYGDTSASSAWEVFGYRVRFDALPYRVTP